MNADIVILTKCQDGLVYRCIDSLAKYVPAGRLGVVAIGYTGTDEGEREKLLRRAKERGLDAVCETMEYNFARNNNSLAFKYGGGNALLFVNDDVELTCDAVSPCLDALDDPRVGTVGIRLDYPDGTIQHAGVFAQFGMDMRFQGVGHVGIRTKNPYPDIWTFGNTGAFMATRRVDFYRARGFDEGFECCYEDVAYNLELMATFGLRNLTLDSVSAVHRESQTRKQAFGTGDGPRLAEKFADLAGPLASHLQHGPRLYTKYEGRNA